MTFLASGLTFEGLLWIVPFALVALAAFGYVIHGTGDTVSNVHTLFDRFLPAHAKGPGQPDPFAVVEGAIAKIVASRVPLLVYGLPAFVWFSLRFFGSVRAALNDVFDTEENRPWYKAIPIDLGLAVVCAVLLTGNTLVSVFVVEAPWIGRFLATLIAFGFSVTVFFIVYTVAPSRHVRWDTALVAAVVASLAFEVAKRLYGFYLAQFATVDRVVSNTNAIALLLFVLWVYYTAIVFLGGGEVAEAYDLARRQREQRAILA